MKILVTGAGGLAGPAIVKLLVDVGHSVVAIPGRMGLGRLPRELATHPKVQIVLSDIADLLPPFDDIDVVVHAAATSPESGATDLDIVHDNVTAMANLVGLAATAGRLKKFIMLSSLSAYGDVRIARLDEMTQVNNPDVYGLTKLLGERMLEGLRCPTLAIRLPAVLGPNPARHWLANMMVKAARGEDINFYSPGTPWNNCIHIDSLADFILGVIELEPDEWVGNTHDMVTVGSIGFMPVEQIVYLVAEFMAQETKSKITIKASGPKSGFMVSSARAVGLFRYRPWDTRKAIEQCIEESGGVVERSDAKVLAE